MLIFALPIAFGWAAPGTGSASNSETPAVPKINGKIPSPKSGSREIFRPSDSEKTAPVKPPVVVPKPDTRLPHATTRPSGEALASLEKLQKLAEMNSSRDDFLKAVKKYYPSFFDRDNHALNKQSKSPCGERGAVSQLRPGPISMDPASGITFRSFATDLEGCKNVIEGFVQTGDKNRPYRFFQFTWLKDGTLYPEIEPVSCNRCHGDPPVPIFRTGFTTIPGTKEMVTGFATGDGVAWPGFFGEIDAKLLQGSDEAAKYSSFLSSLQRDPGIYAHYGYGKTIKSISDLEKGRSLGALLDIKSLAETSKNNAYILPNQKGMRETADAAFAWAREDSLQSNDRVGVVSERKLVHASVATCAGCHTGPNPEGGYLPFDNKTELTRLVNLNNKDAFAQTMLSRATHKIPELRMPPGTGMSAADAKAMQDFLASLKN